MSIEFPDTNYRPIDSRQRYKMTAIANWGRTRQSWSIFARNRLALLGLVLLGMYIVMAVLHPILMRTVWDKTVYDPVVGHDVMIFPHPSSPSLKHPLGTDTLGRDVLSILMSATAPSLQMAFTAALTAAVIGTLIGALSAYYRGAVDGAFTQLGNLSLLAPAPLVMVVIGYMADITPFQFGLIYGVLVGVGAVGIVLRSFGLTIMNRTFIEASRVTGGGPAHIIFRHLVPHMLPLAAINMLLTVTGAVFAMGFIAFLGLSRVQLNWGSMIYDSITYQAINGMITWNVLIPSALAISMFAASFYLIAQGLQDVVDPRLAEQPSAILPETLEKAKLAALPTTVETPTIGIGETEKEPELQVEPVQPAHALQAGEVEIASAQKPLLQEAEILPVTVLVASLQDTPGAEKKSAKELSAGVISVLEHRGASVARQNDNLLVAAFGLETPIAPADGASLATETAIVLTARIDAFNRKRAPGGSATIKLGLGISSGPVTVRRAQAEGKINDALESEAGQAAHTLHLYTTYMKAGGILISQDTFQLLSSTGDDVAFNQRGPAKLASGEKQTMVYEVVGSIE